MTTTKSLLYVSVFLFFAACQVPAKVAAPSEVQAPSKEFYELRNYELANAEQFTAVSAYLKDALIPALKKNGIGPIGLLAPRDTAKDGNYITMLIPYNSLEQFASLQETVINDPNFLQAGSSHLQVEHPNKMFDRIHSRLLVAFDSMASMEVPALYGTPERVFELRSYESASELKGKAKVKMFNKGGEVPIFKTLGFQPVFFATAITGEELPNLVYMVTYKDGAEETIKSKWQSFSKDPRWEAIKGLPEYANTVSKIHSIFMVPLDGSEI